ncbi:hypothetical protein CPC08DRAFT_326208 [Agrocybe pediades]|nr:hypothetical protein CPC08DRAFT_326208 [Agrocybe pediades]
MSVLVLSLLRRTWTYLCTLQSICSRAYLPKYINASRLPQTSRHAKSVYVASQFKSLLHRPQASQEIVMTSDSTLYRPPWRTDLDREKGNSVYALT